MAETKDFFDLIKGLKKTSYDANSVLYTMCEGDTPLQEKKPGKLGGKIWLIGRSYAASPERRHYIFDKDFLIEENYAQEAKKDSKDKKKTYPKIIKTSGDGTANFFEKIEELLKATEEDNKEGLDDNFFADKAAFNEAFDGLINANFTFGGKDNTDGNESENKFLNNADKTILINMVKSVYYFNKILVKAVEKFDDKEGKLKKYYNNDDKYNANKDKVRCKNFISFCSKFLHFHCPGLVFIYDGYSLDGGKALFAQKSKKNNNADIEFWGKKINIEIPPIEFASKNQNKNKGEEIKSDNSVLNSQNEETQNATPEFIDDIMADYIKHVTHAYSLMKFLHDDKTSELKFLYNKETGKLEDNEIELTPRLIDDIFLRIKRVEANDTSVGK